MIDSHYNVSIVMRSNLQVEYAYGDVHGDGYGGGVMTVAALRDVMMK